MIKSILLTAQLVLYTPNAAAVTQQITDRFAEAHHYCAPAPAAHKGAIVIRWYRDAQGVCNQQEAYIAR